MGILTEQPDYNMDFEGLHFNVCPAFDVILDIQNLYAEETLSDVEKLHQALQMIVISGKWQSFSIDKQTQLLNKIYEEYVNVKKHPIKENEIPLIDFDIDGEYIYASFMKDYGIDLTQAQGRLSWRKFLALFQGLSRGTKMREVIRIRGMDIPEYNGKNAKQIQDIQNLKSYYALPIKGGGGKDGLERLFSSLENMAVKR